MRKLSIIFVIILLLNLISYGQGSSGSNARYEYRSLVDVQTAGIVKKGFIGIDMRYLPDGVVIAGLETGVFDNLSFGFAYGGANIIGSGKIGWYKLPALIVRFRIIDETLGSPAVVIGFNSQGKGFYDENLERYQIKSPGFFAAASKTFEMLGYLTLHAGTNFSLERKDGDKDLNLTAGIEKTIGGQVSVVAEYDFAINDNNGSAFGDGQGYFNIGARWSVSPGFTIGFELRDLLDNKKINSNAADRALFVEFMRSIF